MESHYLLYNGNRIFYSTCGDGEPLVLIHGYQMDSRCWYKLIPLLSKKYRLIIPDLPGHGNSSLIHKVNNMEFLADIIFKIILSMGYQGVSIAGHSMGGYVASAFAAKYNTRCDKLILINSHPFADSNAKARSRKREEDLINEGKFQFLVRNFIHINFTQDFRANNPDIIKHFIELSLSQPESGVLADLNGMLSRENRIDIMDNKRKEIRVFLSNDDILNPEFRYSELLERNIAPTIVPNCGHLSIIENPHYLAPLI